MATESAIGVQAVRRSQHEVEMMKLFTSREKQRVAAERAEAEVQRQWSVSRQLRQELQQKEREAEELRGQIAIYKAEFKAVGKRPAAEEPEDED